MLLLSCRRHNSHPVPYSCVELGANAEFNPKLFLGVGEGQPVGLRQRGEVNTAFLQ